MQIHIGRNGQPLGTFSEDQVRDGLASGTFLGTDLAWQEGMDDWKPLSSFSFLNTPPALSQNTAPARVPAPMATSVAPPSSALAIASMICGIVSIPGLMCCLALPLSLAAIICGHLALAEIKKNPVLERSRGMAKAGLIMGYIVVALTIILIVFQVGMAGVSAYFDATNK